MLTRPFLLGLVASLAVAFGVAAAIELSGDGEEAAPPTTTVDGARGTSRQYGMSTVEGDRAVHTMVALLTTRLRSGGLKTPGDVASALRAGVRAVAEAGHDEVFRPSVRSAIFDALWPALDAAGIDPGKVPPSARGERPKRAKR